MGSLFLVEKSSQTLISEREGNDHAQRSTCYVKYRLKTQTEAADFQRIVLLDAVAKHFEPSPVGISKVSIVVRVQRRPLKQRKRIKSRYEQRDANTEIVLVRDGQKNCQPVSCQLEKLLNATRYGRKSIKITTHGAPKLETN